MRILLVLLAVVLLPLAYCSQGDRLFPYAVRGTVLGAVVVGDTLWMETDSSFTPIRTRNGGTTAFFARVYRYRYDIKKGRVVERTRIDYPNVPPQARLYLRNGRIWRVAPGTNGNGGAPTLVETLDPASGAVTMTNDAFISAHPELGAGILTITLRTSWYFEITTRDAQQLYFDMATERLSTATPSSPASDPSCMVLGSGAPRQHVYHVAGACSSYSESELATGQPSLASPTPVAPDHAFIETDVLYSDADTIVILSQDVLGSDAHRMITALSSTGVIWTLPEAQLLKRMRFNGKNTFNQIFFLKSDIGAKRNGDTLLVSMVNDGVQGIDLRSGAVKFVFEP